MWEGRNIEFAVLTPTITAGAYDADDAIGGLLTVAVGKSVLRESGRGEIVTAVLADKASQIGQHAIEAYIFEANPSASTFTDNAAFNINDTDILNCIGPLIFSTACGENVCAGASTANQIMTIRNVGLTYQLGALESKLYVALKIRGAATFTSTSDLQLRLYFARY